VTVYLAAGNGNPPYSYAGMEGVRSTLTDSDGRFGFEVSQPNAYVVQAEQGLDRGRTEVVLVNLDPSQPLEARVVFLAKGTIGGSVRDPNGVAQAGVPVSVRTEGAFTTTLTTETDAAGRYGLPGVFVGDITAVAVNPLSGLAGIARGRLDFEAQGLALDIVLHPTAAVAGTVVERDGVPVASPLRIALRQNGAVFAESEFSDGAAFLFDHVPLGDIELVAEKLANGDRGIASTRLAIVNQTRNLPIRLIGKSEIRATLVTEAGAPVADATVSFRGRGAFAEYRELRSDAEGRALLSDVFAGDFTLTASKSEGVSNLSGSAEGTLIASQPMALTLTLSARPIGAVSGVVRAANGIDPVGAGLVVRMLPEPFRDAFVTTTDAAGHYRFDTVPAGTYTIDALRWFAPNACPDRDRIRGRAGGVTVTEADEEVLQDIQLIGQGELFGRTLAADGSGVAGVNITLTNPDPVTGFNVTCSGATTYVATSDANGSYRFADLPPGNFTLTALAAGGNLQAEGQGRIGFDGDVVELDLIMVDSAIVLPRSFHDANGFTFDIGGNGAVLTGTNNVFAGSAPDANALRLSIVTAGVPVPFVNGNGTIGSLQSGGQQIEVDDGVAAGLTVTRRVFVPRNGYFARTLEILSNPSADPITVGVRLISHHSPAASNPRVVDSSDGDQILSVNGVDGQDRWLVVDDQDDADPFGASSIPATGHMFDGPGAGLRAAQASYSLIGQTGKLLTQWNDITVPVGETVILMHFTWN